MEGVMKNIKYETFTMDHYSRVYSLWQQCEGVGLGSADQPTSIGRFLHRNPGLSLVATSGDIVVGAILCGHDGRRGYLHHLAVSDSFRRMGVGSELVNRALKNLRIEGITKCHLFVFEDNLQGKLFWSSNGWKSREDIGIMSVDLIQSVDSNCPC
jgi:N-acetylglutamate synthase